jgi:ABC-type transporter Mla MlaB component
MDYPSNGSADLNATISRDEVTDTVRIDVLGNLNQASRPVLVHMIQRLRSNGIQSHIRVDLSHAARVQSSALAGLRKDLNAMEGGPGTLGGGVSLMLTGVDEEQPADNTVVPLPIISEVLEEEFAAAFDAAESDTGSEEVAERSSVPLAIRPLEEYSEDELYAASDEVFSLLDDPEAVGGPDLLGRYNDIGEEILRRTPLSEILDSRAERHAAS